MLYSRQFVLTHQMQFCSFVFLSYFVFLPSSCLSPVFKILLCQISAEIPFVLTFLALCSSKGAVSLLSRRIEGEASANLVFFYRICELMGEREIQGYWSVTGGVLYSVKKVSLKYCFYPIVFLYFVTWLTSGSSLLWSPCALFTKARLFV